jgi:group I intron endonuclease
MINKIYNIIENHKMSYTLYKITNSINGKVYIGYTKNAKTRFKDHIRHAKSSHTNQRLHSAIRKYGAENFSFLIVDTVENKLDAIQREIELITTFNSTDPKIGYNLTNGGEGGNFYEFISDDNKQKSINRLKSWANFQKNKTYEDIYGDERAKDQLAIRVKEKH